MTKHIADEQDALLDYLYDEGDPAERLKIARHLQDCATCSVAVIELQSVRGMLNDWTPPDAKLGFRIVGEESARIVEDDQRRAPSLFGAALRSAWAQAAAAVMLFASGMAVSQLRVDYSNGALTVRTRSAAPVSTAAVAAPVSPPARTTDIALTAQTSPSASDFGGLEQELRTRLAASGDAVANDDLLARVKAMIDQSEVRQRRELALRLADVVRDFDTQRRADLVQVQQNFGQLEGQTGAEVAHQRELLNYLVRTSGAGPAR